MAAPAIEAMPSQNRRSKIQRTDDYLQEMGAAYAAAQFYGNLFTLAPRQIAI
jgi:hypothetical protein